jgi:predicted nucleotidyltransferase component of viral defense system
MNDLLSAFNAAGIRYMLAGGQAMRLYGMPRFSMDWDFSVSGRTPQTPRRRPRYR